MNTYFFNKDDHQCHRQDIVNGSGAGLGYHFYEGEGSGEGFEGYAGDGVGEGDQSINGTGTGCGESNGRSGGGVSEEHER